MAERKPVKKGKAAKGFSDEERAAMKERAEELKSAARRGADGEGDVLAKIARHAATGSRHGRTAAARS